MDLALRTHESAAAGLRRVFESVLDDAIARLRDPVADPAITVHEARKRLKEARALLGLMAPAMQPLDVKRERRTLRDAARLLSTARDAAVRVLTLDGLVDGGLAPIPKLRDLLVTEQVAAHAHMLGAGAFRRIDALLVGARDRVLDPAGPYPETGVDPRIGLVEMYDTGQVLRHRALVESSAEAFHAWRRQAKYLAFQLEALEAYRAPDAAPARHLASLLGDEHDLFVLITHVGEGWPGLGGAIAARRATLQAEALAVAATVYPVPTAAWRPIPEAVVG